MVIIIIIILKKPTEYNVEANEQLHLPLKIKGRKIRKINRCNHRKPSTKNEQKE